MWIDEAEDGRKLAREASREQAGAGFAKELEGETSLSVEAESVAQRRCPRRSAQGFQRLCWLGAGSA